MPTIDELDPALGAADTDRLPVSQGGVLKRVTRAQLVAGLQPHIAIAAGQLLGRFSAGTGSPEALSLGTGLGMSNGKLAAVPTSSTDGVPAASFGSHCPVRTDATDARSAPLPYALSTLPVHR